MFYKNFLLLLAIIIAIAGCSLIESYSPAKIPAELTNYLVVDANQLGWSCIGKLEDMRGTAIVKNIITQLDCKAIMEKDEALYKIAIEQANMNIESAKAEWSVAVGTVNQPGWLMSALIGAGGLLGGRFLTQLTHYSETEVEQIKNVAINNLGVNKTNGTTNTTKT
jgi:hypothetical protein